MGWRPNVNCKHNDRSAWCKNENIKRSLFGLGARCCVEYDKPSCNSCEYKEEFPRPVPPKEE